MRLLDAAQRLRAHPAGSRAAVGPARPEPRLRGTIDRAVERADARRCDRAGARARRGGRQAGAGADAGQVSPSGWSCTGRWSDPPPASRRAAQPMLAVFASPRCAFALLAVAGARRSGPLGPDERGAARRRGLAPPVADRRWAKTLTTFRHRHCRLLRCSLLGALVAAGGPTGRLLAGYPAIVVLGQRSGDSASSSIARSRAPARRRDFISSMPSGYAFPSGHTTNATMAYALLARVLTISFPRGRWVSPPAPPTSSRSASGLSRVYLSVHWGHRRCRRLAARHLLADARRRPGVADSGALGDYPSGSRPSRTGRMNVRS